MASTTNANMMPSPSLAVKLRLSLAIPDTWIEQRVAQIDHEVGEDEDRGEEQDPALDHGEVLRQYGRVDVEANARPAENGFRQDGAGQQQADLQPDDRNHRQHRILQHVSPKEQRLAQALRSRGADV